MTDKCKFSCSNKENLVPPIQMQLPQNWKIFIRFVITLLKPTLYFDNFEKKTQPDSLGLSAVVASQRRVYLNA